MRQIRASLCRGTTVRFRHRKYLLGFECAARAATQPSEVFAARPDGTDADVVDVAQLFFGVVGQVVGENYVIGLWSGSIL